MLKVVFSRYNIHSTQMHMACEHCTLKLWKYTRNIETSLKPKQIYVSNYFITNYNAAMLFSISTRFGVVLQSLKFSFKESFCLEMSGASA